MNVLWYIGLGLALPALAFNFTVYALRTAIVRSAAGCDAVQPLGSVDAVRAFAKDCVALIAVVLLIPIGWTLPACRAGAGTRGPLILVHGWALNGGALCWLRRRLLRDGWSPVCCFEYQSLSADIENAALQLRHLVERLMAATGSGPPVALIGHGLGGLVIRYYVRRYPAPKVRRIVTIGTPHGGTALAAHRLGAAARKLAPDSAFLRVLNAGDRTPKQVDVVAIYSTFDALILPPNSARYPQAFNIELNDIGHNALLFSPKVYRLLVENLTAPLL